MKNSQIVYSAIIVIMSFQSFGQGFSLSQKLFESNLYKNDHVEMVLMVTNSSRSSMRIHCHVLENTLDTINWTNIYVVHEIGREKILNHLTTDSISIGQKAILCGLYVSPYESPKSARLRIEYFDISDSSYRDTATFIFHGFDHEKPNSISSPNGKREQGLSIYPNPSKGKFYIKYPAGINDVHLINTSGQGSWKKHCAGDDLIQVNTIEYQPGVYLLKIEGTLGTTFVEQMIIE